MNLDNFKSEMLAWFTLALLFFSLVVILDISGCTGQHKPNIPVKGQYLNGQNSILIDISDIPTGYCLTSMVKK